MGKKLLLLLAAVIAIPSVFAASFGGSMSSVGDAIQRILTLFGSIFNINLSDRAYLGVVKGLFFLMFFAVYNYAARKSPLFSDNTPLARRAANISAFVLAALSAFFIPNDLILDVASIWSVLILLGLALIPAIAAIFFAFYSIQGDAVARKSPGIFNDVVGAALLLLAWFYVDFFYDRLGEVATGTFLTVGQGILWWMKLILPIAFIVKLIQSVFHIGQPSEAGATTSSKTIADRINSLNNAKEAWNNYKKNEAERARNKRDWGRTKWPAIVSNVDFHEVGPNKVEVTWDKNIEDDIERYELKYSYSDPNSWWRGAATATWDKIKDAISVTPDHVPADKNSVIYTVDTSKKMVWYVRAVNRQNIGGYFGKSEFKDAKSTGPHIHRFDAPLKNTSDALGLASLSLSRVEGLFTAKLNIYPPNPASPVYVKAPAGSPERTDADNADKELAAAAKWLDTAAREIHDNIISSADFKHISPKEYSEMRTYVRQQQQLTKKIFELQAVSQHAIIRS